MNIDMSRIIDVGQMGSSIAQVSAAVGIRVVIYDVNISSEDRAVVSIGSNMDRMVAKGTINSEDRDSTLARIDGTTDLGELASADFLIETATEGPQIKQSILQGVGQIMKKECIVASNTSSVSITKPAATLKDASKLIWMHFFNLVPATALVEIIRSIQTSDQTGVAAIELAKTIGKTPILVSNSPGFVVNRLLVPIINEAIFHASEGCCHQRSD